MPKPSLHALTWSQERQHYELHMHGQLHQCFPRGDEPAWLTWLAEHTAFAFVGQHGRISVIKEARERGTGYWYAYRRQDRHTSKRYLGPTAQVTFARLEEVAQVLTSSPSPAPLASLRTPHEASAPIARRFETGPGGAWPNASRMDGQRVALLSPRLSPPRLPISLVERERLLRELDAVRSNPLTLVSASAGSGKTTLLSAWAAASSKRQASGGRAGGAEPAFAWLSLDELDNDPIRFWASVIVALRTCLPKIGEGALAMLHSPQSPPLSTILTALLTEILEVGRDIILILDDYHVIEDQAIGEAMLFLLDHLPATLHLVLATRTDPELPLSRLRVRGQMIEIRASDLRFTREEAASFLTQGMGLPLSEEDVATLSKRTEGWIAGLQLAALSMRKREDLSAFVKDFAGSHRFLLDYVQQDILARLPVTLQNFLLHTSILTSMNAALCQAVTAAPGQQGSQQMLEELERANLFVVPLDEQRQWYRFHDLFRQALRARLQASQPEQVPLLHQRAARWYEAQGELREAIAHTLAAPDYPYAASLMERAAEHLWLSGEAQSVLTWMQALPDVILWQHARLALDAALRLLESQHAAVRASYARALAQVEQTMARVEAVLPSQEEPSAKPEAEEMLPALSDVERAVLGRRLRLLRALIATRAILTHGDAERMRLLAYEAEVLSEDEEVSWKMISLSLTFWLTESLQREGALLIPRLLEVKQQVIQAEDHRALVRVMRWLALAYLRAGQWRLVEQECLEALALVEQIGEHAITVGYLHFYLAAAYYAWNRLAEASGSLHHLRRIAHDWQQADLLIIGNQLLADLELLRGDLAAAHQALQQAEALVQQEGFATHVYGVVATRVEYWLAAGDLAQAATWAAQTTFSPQTWNPNHKLALLMQVRVSLAQQQYPQAIEALECFSAQLDRPGDIVTTIEFLAIYLVALHQAGKRERAQAVAARLLALTEPEGYIRVYLNLGEPMKQVLKTLLATAHEQPEQARRAPTLSLSFVAQLLAAFEQEEKNTRASPRTETPLSQALAVPQKRASASPAPVESLTRREQEVLRLLAEGVSNQEIATALVISLATVKKHVSNLLGKLGAVNRTQAIAQARALSLL